MSSSGEATMDSAVAQLYRNQLVPRNFNPGFVALSYLISLVGAGSTLELMNRRTSHRGKYNFFLLFCSSVSMGGVAIWCMHFIGNRAMDLADGSPEMQVAYSSGFTALSFFVPIVVLFGSFLVFGTKSHEKWWRVGLGGALAGAAICGMHYLGNASIYNYDCEYNPANVVGSAIIAVAASTIALTMFFVFRAAWAISWRRRLASSVMLAGAVSGMHWCAATGTRYRFRRLHIGNTEQSRNITVIIVILLSIAACLIMALMAIISARTMRKYASKAQQVVLAAAVFDKEGRILVSIDGLLPSEKVTDTFLAKDAGDEFSVGHPMFHWMFRASRNWTAVSGLLGAMTNHLAHLPQVGKSRNVRFDIKLTGDYGELIDNYDLVLRELFCLAAQALAEKTKEHITSVGTLWDDILPTGSGPLRVTTPKVIRPGGGGSGGGAGGGSGGDGGGGGRRHSRKETMMDRIEDLAEKGMLRDRPSEPEAGSGSKGSLMFLVRHAEDRDVAKLEVAGYRFADLAKVSGIIGSSMQIKVGDVEGKLRAMGRQAEELARMQRGSHVGFFGIRALVNNQGFDVLVKQGARCSLPFQQLAVARLGGWHVEMLRAMHGMTVPAVLRRLGQMATQQEPCRPHEAEFAADLGQALYSLQTWIGDPIFDEATLIPKLVSLSGRDDSNIMIAFCLMIPIHMMITSPTCEWLPLSFFTAIQLSARNSPHHLAFTRAVHLELSPILNAVPASSAPGGGGDGAAAPLSQDLPSNLMMLRRLSNRVRNLVPARPVSPATATAGGSDGGSPAGPTTDDSGNAVPVVLGGGGGGRPASPVQSHHSGSTANLWMGSSISTGPPLSPTKTGGSSLTPTTGYDFPSGETSPTDLGTATAAETTAVAAGMTAPFGGIMVSQEIMVNVSHAADPAAPAEWAADNVASSSASGKGAGVLRTLGLLPAGATGNPNSDVTYELQPMQSPRSLGRAVQAGQMDTTVQAEPEKCPTFVDELMQHTKAGGREVR